MVVWVVTASKYGSTREIGDRIADELRGKGLSVDTKNAADIEGLDEADVVVLGSAIYAGHWLKDAQALVDRAAEQLASRRVWLFSSGPVGDPPKPEEAEPQGIPAALSATGAVGHKVFAGKLDYAALSLVERLLVKGLKAPEGDFRDWDAIRSWASSIASELQ